MRAALALLVLSCACSTDASDDGGARAFCVSETNMYREMEGVEPVERSSELEAFAQEGAEIDFGTQPHEHFGFDGQGVALAENECPQQGGWAVGQGETQQTVVAQCIRAFYAEGAGGPHFTNLMGPYALVGCGIHEQDGKITIVQDFSNP